MSDDLGNMDFATNYNRISSETKRKIESEVRRLIEEGRARATKLLTDNRKELDIIAKALMEYEVLSLEEVDKVLKGEQLPKLTSKPSVPIKLPELVLPASISGQAGTQDSATESNDSNGDGAAKL